MSSWIYDIQRVKTILYLLDSKRYISANKEFEVTNSASFQRGDILPDND